MKHHLKRVGRVVAKKARELKGDSPNESMRNELTNDYGVCKAASGFIYLGLLNSLSLKWNIGNLMLLFWDDLLQEGLFDINLHFFR